jgi:hypothetical protein
LSLKPKFAVCASSASCNRRCLYGFEPTLSTANPLFRLSVLQHRINHLSALYQQPQFGIQAAFDALVRFASLALAANRARNGIGAAECR